MALQTANQFQLSPDIAGAVSQGVNTATKLQQFSQLSDKQDRQAQVREALAASQAGGPEGEAAKAAFKQNFPEEAQQFESNQLALEAQKFNDQTGRQKQRTITNAKDFLQLQSLGSDQERIAQLQRNRTRNAAAGLDNNETDFLLNQLTNDPVGANNVINSGVQVGERLGIIKPLEGKDGINSISEVQSAKILPGGLVQLVRKDGTVEVKPASEADALLVKESEQRGAELQGLRAGEREGAKGGQKIAIDSFKNVADIRGNISNLKEGIRLVNEEGAETGPIAKRLPSFRTGTVKLKNLRNRLGLDVVGSVTFGALSEGELELALDTALPDNLNEKQIVQWMGDRVLAQEKLANNLEEAAIFLSKPGRTVGDLIERNRERKAIREEAGKQADIAMPQSDLNAEEQIELQQLRALKAQQSGR